MRLIQDVSQVVSWNIRCTVGSGGKDCCPRIDGTGRVSEELQASFETMQLALAPEEALQVAVVAAAVATAVATAQTQGAVERVGVSQGRKQF